MKKIIRYFTLRKRIKQMIIEAVQTEFEWKKNFIGTHPNEDGMKYCKSQVAKYAFLSQ